MISEGDQLWEAGLIYVFSLSPVMKIRLPFMASTFCGGKEIMPLFNL